MTITIETPTGTDDPTATETAPATSPDVPGEVPAPPPTALPVTPNPAPPAAPGARSDEDLLAVLDREVERTGKRPSRKQVMALTRVGNDRAIRLLARLDEQHDWARPASARPRAGRSTRPRTAPTPSADGDRSTGTDLDTPTGTDTTGPVPAAPAAPESVPVPEVSDPGTRDGHGGRMVSWIAFVFGSVTSVAANVLAARIPPVHAPAHWAPSIAAEVGAAVFPLALLLSVEVLSRVRTPSGGYWKLAKIGGTVGVAGGSAVISYGHINEVLTSWHYSGIGAGVGPLVIDGLMIISGFALLALSRRVPVPADPARP